MRLAWFRVIVLAGGLLGLSGCSVSSPDPIVVTGVVYYAGSEPTESTPNSTSSAELVGKPIANAKVTFHDHDLPVGYGITDSLGRFRIRSYPAQARSESVDGLPEGLYSVTIMKLRLVDLSTDSIQSGSTDIVERPLPTRYEHPDTTDWKLIKVKLDTSTNHFRLAIKE